MPKYSVSIVVSYEAEGVVEVDADNEHDARVKAKDFHELTGIDADETGVEIISIECLDDAEDEFDEYVYAPKTHLPFSERKENIVLPCPEPKCKGTLEIRTNRKTGSDFLGCNLYPECKHTQPLPESIKMRRIGAPQLF